MIDLILSLLGSDLGKAIAGVLAIGAALLGFRLKSVSDGVKQQQAKQAEKDLKAEKEVSDAKDRMGAEIARDTGVGGTVDRLRRGGF